MQAEALAFELAKGGSEQRIESLFRAAFDPYVAKLGRRLSVDANRWLPASIAQGKVRVVLDGDEIFGAVAISIEDDRWLIDDIVGSPPAQGCGIGNRMLKK